MLALHADAHSSSSSSRVKWEGVSKPELVPSRIVNKESAQLVIKFYEERLTWNSTCTSNGNSDSASINNNINNNNNSV
jgi:hypothetical protein